MSEINPSQKKIEAGGSNSESHASINDRAGLFTAIIAFGVAMLSLGIAGWALDKAKDAQTQLLLLREDIRQMTIERGK